ncbi:MAG: S1 family peptidase [Chloroflexota bacterium]
MVARATGFLYRNEIGQPHLITNKHVVWEPKDNHYPDFLIAHVRVVEGTTNKTKMSKTRKIRFELNEGSRKMWKAFRSKADIAALEIDETEVKDWKVTYLSSNDSLPEDSNFLLGSEALVLGFPEVDFYDEVSNLPFARSATIATDHRSKFNKKRCFLIDARTHDGMSGSPVVSLPRSIYEKDNRLVYEDTNCYLLGVFSSEWRYGDMPLGLNIVWWPELIEETTQLL